MQAQAFFHDRTKEDPKTEAGYLFFGQKTLYLPGFWARKLPAHYLRATKKSLADNVLINGASPRQVVQTDAHPLISMWSVKGFGSELRTFVRQPKCPALLWCPYNFSLYMRSGASINSIMHTCAVINMTCQINRGPIVFSCVGESPLICDRLVKQVVNSASVKVK